MNHRRKLLKLLSQVTMYCVTSNQFWEVSVLCLAPICVRLPEGGHGVTEVHCSLCFSSDEPNDGSTEQVFSKRVAV